MASWWQQAQQNIANLTSFVGGTYTLLTKRSLPQKQGTLKLTGLHAAVDIHTDSYGVPHIYAQNVDDLYFAQGYVHAQERLWQIEFNRRVASGRLSELFGPVALEVDRFCRRLGLHRAALEAEKQLQPHEQQILEAYTGGINSFIHANRNKLPIEFILLQYKPAPWKITDVIQWGKLQAWNLSGNWETEVIRARLVATLGPEKAAKLEAGYDPNHPLIIPPGVSYQGINPGLLEQYAQLKELSGFGITGGSNNWAVDGSLTESGKPLLCNDPHLGQAVPSTWFECHLVAEDIDVTGAGFAGSPGIVIGHNQHIAWGVTNAISDIQDLYVEKFNPDNPHQYEFQGQWETARVFQEEIIVRGQGAPVIEEVRVTRHGPLLTAMPLEQGQDEVPLALRWTGLESFRLISAIQKLNRAKNWEDFREALRDWDAPPQNFVYADQDGNIGYIMAGDIPVRNRGTALLPSPGWTGEYEWTGMIPFDELPQVYNPEQHFIATANNRVIDDTYPHYISHEWHNGYRAQRIRDLLTSKTKLISADMAAIQRDYYSLPAREIVPFMLKIDADTPLKRAALELLSTWDYTLAATSVGASIYTTFLRKLTALVLNVQLGNEPELATSYLGASIGATVSLNGYSGRTTPLIIRMLREHDDSWFSDSVIPNGPSSWQEALASAFEATIEELREQLGGNILRWPYGALHKMTCNHPLGTVKSLRDIFNRGPFSIGGDADTVNKAESSPDHPEQVLLVPAYRLIVDLENLDSSQSIHLPGQSGHPASSHFDDFLPLWRNHQYHTMPFSRDAVTKATVETLHLQPRSS